MQSTNDAHRVLCIFVRKSVSTEIRRFVGKFICSGRNNDVLSGILELAMPSDCVYNHYNMSPQ